MINIVSIFSAIEQINALVGVLVARWVRRGLINYGTAFAIGPNILGTCTHNILLPQQNEFCDFIIFIPSPPQGRFQQGQKIHHSKGTHFFRCKRLEPVTFDNSSSKQLALIVIEEPLCLKTQQFVKFGNILDSEMKSVLHSIGYPRLNAEKSDLQFAQFRRLHSKGILYKEDPILNSRIRYTNQTYVGSSGCPGFLQKEDGGWKVVFIHTHGGVKGVYNQGLYFDMEVILCLNRWLNQLSEIHNLEMREYFEQQIKQQIRKEEQRQQNKDEGLFVEQSQFSRRLTSKQTQELTQEQKEKQFLDFYEQHQRQQQQNIRQEKEWQMKKQRNKKEEEQFENKSDIEIDGIEWLLNGRFSCFENNCQLQQAIKQIYVGEEGITGVYY